MEIANPLYMSVRKRSGTIVAYDRDKIGEAIRKAFVATRNEWNPVTCADLVCLVEAELQLRHPGDGPIGIETIQDCVERALMQDHQDVAKAYILYRFERHMARIERMGLHPDPNEIANYVHPAKYARWIAAEQRRETYRETAERCLAMHLGRYPRIRHLIMEAWEFVYAKRVLPSMRSMQFGGAKILHHNAAIYNCSYTLIDRPRVFQEIFYLLLCGCGVGFSVQERHVQHLPPLVHVDKTLVRHFTVADSIEGWSDALGALIDGYLHGYYVEFNYSVIRPEGAPLLLSGGVAPGHLPLRTMLERIRSLLSSREGLALRPIDCYDIVCHIAMAVLSGGVRRSSLICLFDLEDEDMLVSKDPAQYRPDGHPEGPLNAHRAMSNNSAVFLRDGGVVKNTFRDMSLHNLIMRNAETPWGEPGFVIVDHPDYGTNPCGEIGLDPVHRTEPDDEAHEAILRGMGYRLAGEDFPPYLGEHYRATGFAFCNLCEINCAVASSERELVESARAAAIIGTLQATFTHFPYLGRVTEWIAERDALLGVGLTGIMDNPKLALDPHVLTRLADVVRETNAEWARLLNIKPAARLTTVKPSGTASLELGCVGSGIHPHHARRYFRRITANPNEAIARAFRAANPRAVETKPNGDWALVFPVEVADSAKTLKDISGLDLMREAISVKRWWVDPGSKDSDLRSPGLTHNVSLTVHFTDAAELDQIARLICDNTDAVSAVSFLPVSSDKAYPFAPREEVTTPEDEAKWRDILQHWKTVDYSSVHEERDGTTVEAACSADGCRTDTIGRPSSDIGAAGLNVVADPVTGDLHYARWCP